MKCRSDQNRSGKENVDSGLQVQVWGKMETAAQDGAGRRQVVCENSLSKVCQVKFNVHMHAFTWCIQQLTSSVVQRGTLGDRTVGTDSFMIDSARAANFDASFTFPMTTFFSGATAPISLNT